MPTIFEEAVSLRALVGAAAAYAERNAILVALARNHWCKARTAKTLKISVPTLVYKMRKHALVQSNTAEAEDES